MCVRAGQHAPSVHGWCTGPTCVANGLSSHGHKINGIHHFKLLVKADLGEALVGRTLTLALAGHSGAAGSRALLEHPENLGRPWTALSQLQSGNGKRYVKE